MIIKSPRATSSLLLRDTTQRQQRQQRQNRQRQESNLCGQSPMDFKSISLTTRTRCPATNALHRPHI